MKPIIAITGNHLMPNPAAFEGSAVSYTPQGFVDALQAAGAVPLIVPISKPEEARAYIALTDGLLLTGGYDINPALYGEEAIPQLEALHPKRDASEMALIEAALEKGIPILGVCRGMQLLNVYYGGTLYQDLPAQYGKPLLQHVQLSAFHIPIQQVAIQSGSYLQELLGVEKLWVNSFHHQAIKELGNGLTATAVTSDGVIEAIELQDTPSSVLGIQWHPEIMLDEDEASRTLFLDLVNRAREVKTKMR